MGVCHGRTIPGLGYDNDSGYDDRMMVMLLAGCQRLVKVTISTMVPDGDFHDLFEDGGDDEEAEEFDDAGDSGW